jgi:hypothetical protein
MYLTFKNNLFKDHTEMQNASAFPGTFCFFANALTNTKKIKRACKPTQEYTANMGIQ